MQIPGAWKYFNREAGQAEEYIKRMAKEKAKEKALGEDEAGLK